MSPRLHSLQPLPSLPPVKSDVNEALDAPSRAETVQDADMLGIVAPPRAPAALLRVPTSCTQPCTPEMFADFFGIQPLRPSSMTLVVPLCVTGVCPAHTGIPPILANRLGAGSNTTFQIVMAGISEAASRDLRLREVLAILDVRASVLAAKRLLQSKNLPFLRHVLAHSGTSLDQHAFREQRSLFENENRRIYMSTRPMTALFSLSWIRVLSMMFGMLMLAVNSITIAGFWTSTLTEYAEFTGRYVRFTALALSDKSEIKSPGVFAIGLTRGGCHVFDTSVANPGMKVNATRSSITMTFPDPVPFDGWFLITSANTTDLDPVIFALDASEDGKVWNRVASSLRRDKCGNRNEKRSEHLDLLDRSVWTSILVCCRVLQSVAGCCRVL